MTLTVSAIACGEVYAHDPLYPLCFEAGWDQPSKAERHPWRGFDACAMWLATAMVAHKQGYYNGSSGRASAQEEMRLATLRRLP